jgi:uncharacterized protein
MKALIEYNIPFSGLKNGTHLFDFQVDKQFFKHFENSLIEVADLNVKLSFDKRPSMFVLDFEFSGTVQVLCDRCSEDFDLPVAGKQQMIVKLSEVETEDDEEIIYIRNTETDFSVAPLVYEVLHLNMPLKKACALDESDLPVCGFDFEDFAAESDAVSDDEHYPPSESNPFSALKNMDFEN